MTEEKNSKQEIDLLELFKMLCTKKKYFFVVWIVTIALSALWIFPKPRFYTCEVSLAPESTGEDISSGSLASLASSFGVNLGTGGTDAIYPDLYPDLFESPEFIVSLFSIQVKTADDSIHCDYYTYLAKHQKQNWLTSPFTKMARSLKQVFSSKPQKKPGTGKGVNSFRMTEFDNDLVEMIQGNIKCSVDKKYSVITISTEDQDPLVCAILADSVRARLQSFIIEYRTHKTRIDVQHYQSLADSANLEYRSAVNKYAQFCDANQDILLQSQQSKRDELENEMQMAYNTYSALAQQLEAMKVKLQERTPAFTTLKSATVPVKPAGPKRMIFIIAMLFVTTIGTCIYFAKGFVMDQLAHIKK